MRERPILFSAPMVRAILAGTKTQTRRLVTGTPEAMAILADARFPPTIEDIPDRSWMDSKYGTRARWQIAYHYESADGIGDAMNAWCPYGHRWTKLWVRETWGYSAKVSTDGDQRRIRECDTSHLVFRADDGQPAGVWRPSIHMPRWASRITLEITNVRVERLRDISEEDARAEGIDRVVVDDDSPPDDHATGYTPPRASYVGSYSVLWDELNKRRAPWSSNPWVWVIAFKRAE